MNAGFSLLFLFSHSEQPLEDFKYRYYGEGQTEGDGEFFEWYSGKAEQISEEWNVDDTDR